MCCWFDAPWPLCKIQPAPSAKKYRYYRTDKSNLGSLFLSFWTTDKWTKEEFVTKQVLTGELTHIALSFKTFKRHSAIVLDWVLNKGQHLWSFTEVCESWSAFRGQEATRTVPGKGAWHTAMGHHLTWLLGCCYQQDPVRCPQIQQGGGDLPQPLGTSSEPCSNGVLVFPAQHAEEALHHALRNNSVMVGQIITSHHLSAPTQWQSPEAYFPSSQSTRRMSISLQWPKEMTAGRCRRGTLFSDSEKPCCGKWHNLKWWFETSSIHLKKQKIHH